MNWINVVLTPSQIELLLELVGDEMKAVRSGATSRPDGDEDELKQIHNILIQHV